MDRPPASAVDCPRDSRHQTEGRSPTPGDGHRLRRPGGPDRRRRRGGPHSGGGLGGQQRVGYEDTLQVTVDDMAHHTAAVARARPRPLVVADLPWMSYHVDPEDAIRNGAILIRAGRQAVKLEGGANRTPMIEALVAAEIPVMGHIGLTPQSVNAMGGSGSRGGTSRPPTHWFGRPRPRGRRLFRHRPRGRPRGSGAAITESLDVPTIGIGAGPAVTDRCWSSTMSSGSTGRSPSSYAATATSEPMPLRRWRRMRPTCAREPSPPTPRSTTEAAADGRSRTRVVCR